MNIELSGHYGYRRIAKSVWPSIVMVLVTSVYSIVDGFFVSNFAGKSGFAAINLTFPVIMMIGSLGLMIGAGGGALTAKLKGEGRRDEADRVFSMLVRFGLALGAVLGVLMAIFAPLVSRWLGSDEAMMDECVTYIRLNMLGMPGFLLQCAFQSFYMSAERPQLGTLMSVVAGVTNIALDALFIYAWAWLGRPSPRRRDALWEASSRSTTSPRPATAAPSASYPHPSSGVMLARLAPTASPSMSPTSL